MMKQETPPPAARYRWPWLLLAAVVLGVLLAVLWLTAETRRIREQRQYDFVPPGSSVAPTPTPSSAASLGAWTTDMVWIPGGTFWMGAEDGQVDEKPVHQVT
jgi:formylglycine-generating enzyme required for sulfatase activity